MKKFLLIILTLSIFITGIYANAQNTKLGDEFIYADVCDEELLKASAKLVELNILKGERIGDMYYLNPSSKVERILAICYINSALKINNKKTNHDNKLTFSDSENLSENLKNQAYISMDAKIIAGNRDDDNLLLNPYNYVTRSELYTMIYRAMGIKSDSDIKLNFIDANTIPDYSKICIKTLVKNNIISNNEGEYLHPNEPITKGEMILMLYELVKYNESSTVKTLSQRIKEEFYGKIVT